MKDVAEFIKLVKIASLELKFNLILNLKVI